MQPFSLSSISSAQSLSLISNNHLQTLRFKAPPQCYSSRICTPANQFTKKQVLPFGSSFLGFNPLRDRFDRKMVPMKKKLVLVQPVMLPLLMSELCSGFPLYLQLF